MPPDVQKLHEALKDLKAKGTCPPDCQPLLDFLDHQHSIKGVGAGSFNWAALFAQLLPILLGLLKGQAPATQP